MSELIGNTPILKVSLPINKSELYLKLENFNPGQSMKDRMAKSMLDRLTDEIGGKDDICVVESSSGNTATALSYLCKERKYRFMAVVDKHASIDKIRAIKAFGGEVHYVNTSSNELSTAIRDQTARYLSTTIDNMYWTAQHDNLSNEAGYYKMAFEILEDIGPDLNIFISAIGTGGSLCGTARILKRNIPELLVIGVEPEGSIIFGGPSHSYSQSGTGTPEGADVGLVIDYDLIDKGMKVKDVEAFATARVISRELGLCVGGSSGGVICKALKLANTSLKKTKILSIVCDSGFKYLDTIYNDDWINEKYENIEQYETEIYSLLR